MSPEPREREFRRQETGVRKSTATAAGWPKTEQPDAANKKPAKSFRELIVWQKAHSFTVEVYRVTHDFPADERYGLSLQFRKAAVSIPANICEGFRRRTAADKRHFMNMAQGSLEECRYYIILSHDLGYLDGESLERQLDVVGKLLSGYERAIAKHCK